MRAGLVVATLALCSAAAGGCLEHVLNVCNVDSTVEAATGATTITDCGNFYRGGVNYTDDAMRSAQLCVLNAVANKQAFRLTYDADPTAGAIVPGLRAGWVGTVQVPEDADLALNPAARTLRLRTYAGQGGGDMASKDDLVSVQPCDRVDATQSCAPRVGVPCLTCTTTQPSSVQCRG